MSIKLLFPLAAVVLLVGCVARQREAALIEYVPPPSLDAPRIAPQPVRVQVPEYRPPVRPQPRLTAPPPVASVPRQWVPLVTPRPWHWIVIHHSASPSGNMAVFDREHKAKGWDGVGYHFVIGNGTGSGDGQIEVTPRWPIQKWGAHAKTPDNRFNDYGIGICLVGNFDQDRPTPAQVRSLIKLTTYLMKTYNIAPDCVIGHRDTGRATDCPGHNFHVAVIRQMAAQEMAAQNLAAQPTRTASTDLLRTPSDSN